MNLVYLKQKLILGEDRSIFFLTFAVYIRLLLVWILLERHLMLAMLEPHTGVGLDLL